VAVVEESPISVAVGNGVTVLFSFSFGLQVAADLVVQTVVGAVTTQYELTADYSVDLGARTVTFLAAPENGASVVMFRRTRLARSTDYQNNGDLLSAVLNKDFDRLWQAMQDLSVGGYTSGNTVRAPSGDLFDPLPNASLRASKQLLFDDLGRPYVGAPVTGTAADVMLNLAASTGSSLLGFIAAGAGAVSRTVQSKLRDWVSADDFPSLQAAVDAVWNGGAGSGVVCVHSNKTLVSALIMRSGVYVYVPSNATTITVTGAGQTWPLYSCVLFGGYSSPNFSRSVSYAINSTTAGWPTVTLTTPAQAANFAPGDVVAVETVSTFTVIPVTDVFPTQLQMNVVESANSGTGVVQLRYGISEAQASARIRQFGPPGVNMLDVAAADTGVPLRAVRDCGIIGGTWIAETSVAPFCGTGGAVNCVIKPHRVIAAAGPAYGNFYAYCTFDTDVVQSRRFGIELGGACHGNRITCGSITCEDSGQPVERLVGVNEGSRDNFIHVTDFNSGNDTADVGVQITNSTRNRIIIDSLRGAAIDAATGAVVLVGFFNYTPGANVSPTDNFVEIGQSRVAAQGRYISMAEEADRTTVRGNFYGPISLSGSAALAGSDDNDIEVWCENGAPSLAAGSTGNRIAGTFGLDMAVPTDYAAMGANRLEYETPAYKALRALGYMLAPASYTSASGLSRTTTFPAGTFKVGDVLRFSCRGVATGAAGTKVLQLAFSGTTFLDLSGGSAIPTGSQGVDVDVEIYIQGNTVAVGTVRRVIGSTVTMTDIGITGLNFTTTVYTFVQTVTVAAPVDTLTMRNSRLVCHRPFTNNVAWI
jgi:hypothetical protein